MQGIRRVVALTGEEAVRAIKHAAQLSARITELQEVSGPALEKEAAAIKQASTLPKEERQLREDEFVVVKFRSL